jgi:hypothetical protein
MGERDGDILEEDGGVTALSTTMRVDLSLISQIVNSTTNQQSISQSVINQQLISHQSAVNQSSIH